MKKQFKFLIIVICFLLTATVFASSGNWDIPNVFTKAGPFLYPRGNESLNVTRGGANISATNYLNASGGMEWIMPENVADIDKEDIESDLNTFVDIAGDNMTGNLRVDGESYFNHFHLKDNIKAYFGDADDWSVNMNETALVFTPEVGTPPFIVDDFFYLDVGNDRVGIGTSSPTANLDIYNPTPTANLLHLRRGSDGASGLPTTFGKPYLRIGGGEYNASLNYFHTIGIGYRFSSIYEQPLEIGLITRSIYGSTLGDFVIGLKNTTGNSDLPREVFRVTYEGNVGIGTTTPSHTLNVVGDANITGTIINTDFTTLTDNSMADTLHRHSELSASDGSPDRAVIVDASGNVGIGISPPTSKLHVNGSLTLPELSLNYSVLNAPGGDGLSPYGLVAYYPLDDNAFDFALDNDGVVTGATLNKTNFKIGTGAYEFDGSGDYIRVNDFENYDNYTSGLTISAWIYMPTIVRDTEIISKNWRCYMNRGWNLGVYSSSDQLAFSVCNETGIYVRAVRSMSPTVTANRWYYVVGIWNGTHTLFYLNGNLVDSDSVPSGNKIRIANNYNMDIGTSYKENDNFFNGTIDEVAIYNRTLSSEEIKRMYQRGAEFHDANVFFSKLGGNIRGNITPQTETFSLGSSALRWFEGWFINLDVKDLNAENITTENLTVNGNAGIGTTTPNEKLTVVGNINVSGNLNVSGGNLFTKGCICYDNGATCLGTCI